MNNFNRMIKEDINESFSSSISSWVNKIKEPIVKRNLVKMYAQLLDTHRKADIYLRKNLPSDLSDTYQEIEAEIQLHRKLADNYKQYIKTLKG